MGLSLNQAESLIHSITSSQLIDLTGLTASVDWVDMRLLNASTGQISFDWMSNIIYYNATPIIDYGFETISPVTSGHGFFLNDYYNRLSIDWHTRVLVDTSNAAGIDWGNRLLITSDSLETLDWQNRLTLDSQYNTSFNWETRRMYDYNENNSINWNDRILYNTTGSEYSIDWQNGQMYANPDSTNNVIVLDWASQILSDWRNGSTSVDWFSRRLVDYNDQISVDWSYRCMRDENGIPSIGWSYDILYDRLLIDSNYSNSVNWQNRCLIYPNGYDVSVDWQNGQLYSGIVSESVLSIDYKNYQMFAMTEFSVSSLVIDYGMSRLVDWYTNTESVNWSDRTLIDSNEYVSLNWSNRELRDENYNISIGWGWDSYYNRVLVSNNGSISVDWENRYLRDDENSIVACWYNSQLLRGGDATVDWYARVLYDSDYSVTVDWENGYLKNYGGQTVYDWYNGRLYDNNNQLAILFDVENRVLYNISGLSTIDFHNQVLIDPATSTGSLDWFNRQLIDNIGDVSINYQTRILSSQANGTEITYSDGVEILTNLNVHGDATVQDWHYLSDHYREKAGFVEINTQSTSVEIYSKSITTENTQKRVKVDYFITGNWSTNGFNQLDIIVGHLICYFDGAFTLIQSDIIEANSNIGSNDRGLLIEGSLVGDISTGYGTLNIYLNTITNPDLINIHYKVNYKIEDMF